jgi:hypothetical protein
MLMTYPGFSSVSGVLAKQLVVDKAGQSTMSKRERSSNLKVRRTEKKKRKQSKSWEEGKKGGRKRRRRSPQWAEKVASWH